MPILFLMPKTQAVAFTLPFLVPYTLQSCAFSTYPVENSLQPRTKTWNYVTHVLPCTMRRPTVALLLYVSH